MATENSVDEKDVFRRLHKFLICGAEAGTYFPGEKIFLHEHVTCIDRLISDGYSEDIVDEILKYADSAVNDKSVIYALALCARNSNITVKTAAYKALPSICKNARQLFKFIDYCELLSGQSTGWGRSHRSAIQRWYNSFEPRELAQIVTKHIQCGGWSHVDVLRLAHVKSKNDAVGAVLKYIVRGYDTVKKDIRWTEADGLSPDLDTLTKFITDVHTLKHSHDEHQVACLVAEYRLSIEYIPTWMSKSKQVWLTLVPNMPVSQILELLGRMSCIGLLEPGSDGSKAVIERLNDEKSIQQEKLQPFDVLVAMKAYESGKGERGKIKWAPNCHVLDAVNKAFYTSIKLLEPTNKRYLIAVDVSGSMAYGSVNGCRCLSPAITAAAIAMMIARTESDYQMVAFSTGISPVKLIPQMDLLDICKEIAEIPTGGTDCALPILWAMEKKKSVDVFIVLTDCETLSGQIHPSQALQQYRHILNNQNSKLIVCALTSSGFTIANPLDVNMLDVAGFDAGAAKVIRSFIEGRH